MAILVLIAASSGAGAKGLPDTIELGSIANLYEKVKFDHAGHIKLIKDCAECHHHTTGTLTQNPNCVKCHGNSGATASVACRSCHFAQPFSAAALRQKDKNAYHNDIMGLKGAYHQACTGCHNKMGGPTGCQDCHARTKEGDAFYSAGAAVPQAGKEKKHRD
ncbi:MAG TPA: cytochrome c3 family protein [Geobacteraceae bacterium]|nr:cytochrome c3 family protein [Geobacteraceae bacterium]